MGRTGILKNSVLTRAHQQKGSIFFDCTNTTSRILDILEQERSKIILCDELEKMKRQYDFTIKGAKVFASGANDLNKLSAPLRSRFRRLHLPKYSKKQFLEVAVKVCPKLSEEMALLIGGERVGT